MTGWFAESDIERTYQTWGWYILNYGALYCTAGAAQFTQSDFRWRR